MTVFNLKHQPNGLTGKFSGPKTDLFLKRGHEFVAEFSPLVSVEEAQEIVDLLNRAEWFGTKAPRP